jgi:opacity protein-like surface antigen
MRKLILALAASALPALASAQVAAAVELNLRLPVVLPQLVVVTPGVQVVPDVDEEVFFVDGYYWARQPRGWYRSNSHRGGWVLVPARRVPVRVASLPPGKYKRWKAEKHERRDDDRRDRGGHDHGQGRGHGKGHGKH